MEPNDNHRLKRILISPELFVDMFGGGNFRIIQTIDNMLPEGTKVVNAAMVMGEHAISLVVQHPSFEQLDVDAIEDIRGVPVVEPMMTSIRSSESLESGVRAILADIEIDSRFGPVYADIEPDMREAIVAAWTTIMIKCVAPGIFVETASLEPDIDGAFERLDKEVTDVQ